MIVMWSQDESQRQGESAAMRATDPARAEVHAKLAIINSLVETVTGDYVEATEHLREQQPKAETKFKEATVQTRMEVLLAKRQFIQSEMKKVTLKVTMSLWACLYGHVSMRMSLCSDLPVPWPIHPPIW